MKNRRMRLSDLVLRTAVYAAAGLTFLALFFIIVYILVRGVPNLKPSLFSWNYNSENVSLMPALITTVMTAALSLLFAVPFGVFTAVFLVEYSKKGSRLVGIIRITAETLAGIPSIVYGLFGMLFFVTQLKLGFSLLSGALTLSVMILPLMIRTAEEALKSVPDAYREGSFGLGAGRLRTVFAVVLPPAVPGILAGVILSVGRIVGETAALIYTAGTVAKIPENVLASGRTLSVHMYALSSEGLHSEEAYATAVVLLLLVTGLNALAAFAAKKITGGNAA